MPSDGINERVAKLEEKVSGNIEFRIEMMEKDLKEIKEEISEIKEMLTKALDGIKYHEKGIIDMRREIKIYKMLIFLFMAIIAMLFGAINSDMLIAIVKSIGIIFK